MQADRGRDRACFHHRSLSGALVLMPLAYHAGVPFVDSVLEAAERNGVADQVAAISTRYRSQHGSLAVAPARGPRSRPGQVRARAVDLGIEAILDAVGVVVGFRAIVAGQEPAREATRGRQGPSSPPARRKAAGGGRRGPRDWSELMAMLQDAGYRVEHTGKHRVVVDPAGARVYVLAATASDHRALLNATSGLRRATGLELRTTT